MWKLFWLTVFVLTCLLVIFVMAPAMLHVAGHPHKRMEQQAYQPTNVISGIYIPEPAPKATVSYEDGWW